MNNKELLDQARHIHYVITNKVSRAEAQQDIDLYSDFVDIQQKFMRLCDQTFGKGWEK